MVTATTTTSTLQNQKGSVSSNRKQIPEIMKMWTAMTVMVVAMAVSAGAQDSDTPDCAQKLVPCANYMNDTSPPATCCDPIKEAVKTQLKCLCDLYNTPGLLASFGITVPQALNLTKNCGVDPNTSSCNITQGAVSPTSAVPPPPGVPGNGAGSTMAWTGLSTLLLSVASVMLLY